ncbi:MAG: RNA pseudouridine synthase [Tenacibaculum sp.]|nr:RNA pseudouridine synthase [Tenacibaculum sp.]
MFSPNTLIHFLQIDDSIKLPEKFTYPFQYTPHSLCKIASNEVQKYLENQSDIKHNFNELGKMFGVLIVKTTNNKLAYLTAFSGKIDEKTHINGFIPPIFDTLSPNNFYKQGEQKINNLTNKIKKIENSLEFKKLKNKLNKLEIDLSNELKQLKTTASNAKKERKIKRTEAKNKLSEKEFEEFSKKLDNESMEYHYKIKDFKKYSSFKILELQKEFDFLNSLKEERKQLSANLQKELHGKYIFLNAKQETKKLTSIFNDIPPAGSGECSAPKLLQFAYKNNLHPIAMAEFWWGKQPPSEIRVHKHFYPSCKSKCKPILNFMLQGLEVDENPVKNRKNIKLEIIFEDDYLLAVNKPHEFLSVSGKEIKDSVLTRMKEYLPNATGALLVHRLDMSTSGLLLVAKTTEVHKNLQKQFSNRTIKKRYIAILDGIISQKAGTINLPLFPDYNNLPHQLVCFKNGKPSITKYKVIGYKNNKTKIYLYPETGRTHQLRVHCAHHLGLNTPILGDDLYGTKQNRLHLHAEKLIFKHPITGKTIELKSKAKF